MHCPVLQYADDTLIVLPPDASQIQTLKNNLLQFSEATGLKINFHKSKLFRSEEVNETAKQTSTCSVVHKANSLLDTWEFRFIIDASLKHVKERIEK